MSKNSLLSLKSQIDGLEKSANSCHGTMSEAENKLIYYMNDVVGQSAQESMRSIKQTFSYNMDKSVKTSKNTVNEMVKAYDEIKRYSDETESLLRQAEQIKAGLGKI